MSTEGNAALGNKFFVILSGKTNGAHQWIVERLRDYGQTQVDSSEGCDYFLVFCPVVSRVGTDIHEALNKISDGKKAILVVMHHTFNPSHIVADSRRLVQKPNIILTVDCLFYECELLRCDRNNNTMSEIEKTLGVPISWVTVKSSGWRYFIYRFKFQLLIFLLLILICLILICSFCI